MPPTRLLFATTPPLLRQMIQDALADKAGVAVVGDVSEEDLPWAASCFEPNLILVQEGRRELSDIYLRLMYRAPRLRLVAISADGRKASVYRLQRSLFEDVSMNRLVEMIRDPDGTAFQG